MAPDHARRRDLVEGDVLSQRLLDEDLKHLIHLTDLQEGRSLCGRPAGEKLMHLHQREIIAARRLVKGGDMTRKAGWLIAHEHVSMPLPG